MRYLPFMFMALFLAPPVAKASDLLGRYWAQDSLSLEEDIDEPDELLDSQSEDYLLPKSRVGRWQFTLVPFAFDVYPLPTYGAQVGYMFSETWGVDLGYGFGAADAFDRQVKVERTALRVARYFWHATFVGAGLGARNVRSLPLPSKELTFQDSTSYWTVDAAIGKLWIQDTFVIGVDFWGVTIPWKLIQIRGEDLRDLPVVDDDSRRYRTMAHETTYHALRVRFGAEF